MKIQSTQNIHYNTVVSRPVQTISVQQHNTVTDKSLNFLGKADLVKNRARLGSEIKSFEEYLEIMDKIYNYRINGDKPLFSKMENLSGYKKAKKEEEGLLLYAGDMDLSDDINRFLSGREMREMSPSQARNVIKALDYSLKKLDDKYGKYSGIVYRQGFFPLNQKQFISTTTDPVIAATLRGGIYFDKNMEFSIINLKNGHKIRDFQRRVGSGFAEEEEEILAPRQSSYREVFNPVGQYYVKKHVFHKLLETYAHREINPNRIRIFEEI